MALRNENRNNVHDLFRAGDRVHFAYPRVHRRISKGGFRFSRPCGELAINHEECHNGRSRNKGQQENEQGPFLEPGDRGDSKTQDDPYKAQAPSQNMDASGEGSQGEHVKAINAVASSLIVCLTSAVNTRYIANMTAAQWKA